MSLTAYLKQTFSNRPEQRFAPEQYWERRHESNRGSLKAVGHLQLTDAANARQYEIKRDRIVDLIRRYVGAPSGKTLLDAGCGTGVLTSAYVRLGFEVVGVDFSATAIRQAQENEPNARFVVAPLPELDLGKRFEVITAIDVLLHLIDDQEWKSAVSALARHLTPDGVLIILDHLQESTGRSSNHVRPRSTAELTAALADVGLHIAEHQQFDLPIENATKDLLAVRHR